MMLNKKILCVLMPLLLIESANGASLEEKVVRSAGEAYAKEQLKQQLANYLNKNPSVVFSKNPQIGSQSVKFLGKAVAAYGFATAKTDRDRAWSAAYLILSPEPTTAAILIAAQLIDSYLEMQAEARVADMAKEIAELRSRADAISTQLKSQEVHNLQRLILEIKNSLDRIEVNQDLMSQSVFFESLNPLSDKVPSEEDIEVAINLILSISADLDAVDQATQILALQESHYAPLLPRELIRNYIDDNRALDEVRSKFLHFKQSYSYFYASLHSEALIQKINDDTSEYSQTLYIYRTCTAKINSLKTAEFVRNTKLTFDDRKVLEECSLRLAQIVKKSGAEK